MKVIFTRQREKVWRVGAASVMKLCIACWVVTPTGAGAWATAFESVHSWQADCAPFFATEAAAREFQLVRAQILAQGMKLDLQGCPYVRITHNQMQQVLDVRVVVVQSEVASQFVRGPLADGEEVDMGSVHLEQPPWTKEKAKQVQEEVSPDVLHNRAWLAHLMKTRGWKAVSGYWWAFVPAEVSK